LTDDYLEDLMARRKVIVTVAPTGGLIGKAAAPHLPTQPQEIADAVRACSALGASVAALHARRSDDTATCDPDVYRSINGLVRQSCDVVINNSTGGGVGPDLIRVLPDGRKEVDFNARLSATEAGAEMCTFDPQTMSMVADDEDILFHTPFKRCILLAERMRAEGIKPEWEIYSPADLPVVERLISMGYDAPPYYINIVLGTHKSFSGTSPYSSDILELTVRLLPAESIFCVSAIGAAQLPATTEAIIRGGHVRVGLEDNLQMEAGVPATNESLVERTVSIVEKLGCEPATAAEARELLGLRPLTMATTVIDGAGR
jgi:3-keto-5-aminohexanoate cleavage enzyme